MSTKPTVPLEQMLKDMGIAVVDVTPRKTEPQAPLWKESDNYHRSENQVVINTGPAESDDFWGFIEVRGARARRNADAILLHNHHFEKLEAALRQLNHMGGDERGGYCICPVNDGSAPQYRHSSCCVDARTVLAAIAAERAK